MGVVHIAKIDFVAPMSKQSFPALITSISACSKIDRPKMAYDQKDKGTVLEMESFNVKTSAENFQKSSSKFSENAKQMKQNNKNTTFLFIAQLIKFIYDRYSSSHAKSF